jgi:type I restriction enzyme M protein
MAESPLHPLAQRFAEHPAAQSPFHLLAPLAALLVLRWADLQEADQEAIAAFDGTPFAPSLAPGSRWRDFSDLRDAPLAQALTTRVLPALDATRDAGSGALVRRVSSVLQTVTTLDPAARDLLVDFVQSLPLATPADRDQSLDAFDTLLGRSVKDDPVSGGGLLPPRPVVDLVVELARPRPGERIYDPCFGVAAMLAAFARSVRRQIRAGSPEARIDFKRGAFLGVEINPESFVIGMARMILAGVDRPAVELGNTLERPLPRDRATEGFDCIVAEPPFGGRLAPDAASQFAVKATSAEALFLQHIAASLRPGGRAVVVLPQGAFFRGGADAAVRRILLDEYRIEAVVSLPPGAYLPASNVRAGVLVFRREPPSENVYFIDGDMPIEGPLPAEPGAPLFDPHMLASTALGMGMGGYPLRDATVEELKRDDASLRPPRRDAPLSVFLQAVGAADAGLPVHTLEHVAELFAGFRIKSGDLASGDADPALLGLLGPVEVDDGATRPPGRFLTKQAAVPPQLRLRSGDVVLTLAGVIGRAAVVANGATGCVAGNGLALLRPRDDISPHYLVAMLQSEPVRAWIQERARGSLAQSLPLAELKKLALPVPDVGLQDRVLRTLRRDGGDATAILLKLLAAAVEDPVAQWLGSSRAVQDLMAMRDIRIDEREATDALLRVVTEVLEVEMLLVVDSASSPELGPWFEPLSRALRQLAGIQAVPRGPGRLAILMNLCLSLVAMGYTAMGLRSPAGKRAAQFRSALIAVVEPLCHRQAEDFALVPSLEPATLEAGASNTVTLHLRNDGPMPLRQVEVWARRGPWGRLKAKAPYLEAGAEVTAAQTFVASPGEGTIPAEVTWSAVLLDGHYVDGTFPLVLEVKAARPAAPPTPDLGESPYIVGSPIGRSEMLYGRDALLRDIKRQLATDHRANVILLEGNRRTGKTSILERLKAPGELPAWIPVYLNLQRGEGSEGRAGLSSTEIFRLLANGLALALIAAGTPVWLPDQPPPDPNRRYDLQLRRALTAYFEGDHPFEAFDIYLSTVIEAVAPRRVLLMLDEFDKIQEGIDAGITSPQVPENLRYLFHAHPELGGILSGSRRLTRLRNEYWSALFGIGYAIRVAPLAVDDARALVTEPVAGRLVYVPAARDRIVELCARQPFLIQTLCNRIFKQTQERGERMVTLDAVERAADEMTGDNEHFETLWGYAGTNRRRLILALLCQLGSGNEGRPLDAGTLEDALVERGVAIPKAGLGDDFAHLRELELLDLETYEGYQRYRLTIPLLASWILRNKDFSDLDRGAVREQDEARE